MPRPPAEAFERDLGVIEGRGGHSHLMKILFLLALVGIAVTLWSMRSSRRKWSSTTARAAGCGPGLPVVGGVGPAHAGPEAEAGAVALGGLVLADGDAPPHAAPRWTPE